MVDESLFRFTSLLVVYNVHCMIARPESAIPLNVVHYRAPPNRGRPVSSVSDYASINCNYRQYQQIL